MIPAHQDFCIRVRDNRLNDPLPSILFNRVSLREWDDLCAEINSRVANTSHAYIIFFVIGFLCFFGFFIFPIMWGPLGAIPGFISFFAVAGFFSLGSHMQTRARERAYDEVALLLRSTINSKTESRGVFFRIEPKKTCYLLHINVSHVPSPNTPAINNYIAPSISAPPQYLTFTDDAPAAPPVYHV
ncbi:hypothetical protein RCL1_004906 [Eukaryota sp. TZLM3-RCL]